MLTALLAFAGSVLRDGKFVMKAGFGWKNTGHLSPSEVRLFVGRMTICPVYLEQF